MASRMVWEGLDELVAEILALPAACTGEGQKLAEATANAVTFEIRSAYAVRTGDTRNKTKMAPLKSKGEFVAGAMVTNTSKLALIIENGSQARHYFTVNGVKHLTGKMPPAHVFVPRIVRARQKLLQQLKAMVTRHGATVTGEP
jgi:hypothetical protein